MVSFKTTGQCKVTRKGDINTMFSAKISTAASETEAVFLLALASMQVLGVCKLSCHECASFLGDILDNVFKSVSPRHLDTLLRFDNIGTMAFGCTGVKWNLFPLWNSRTVLRVRKCHHSLHRHSGKS